MNPFRRKAIPVRPEVIVTSDAIETLEERATTPCVDPSRCVEACSRVQLIAKVFEPGSSFLGELSSGYDYFHVCVAELTPAQQDSAEFLN